MTADAKPVPPAHVLPAGVTQERTWRAPDGTDLRYTVTAEWLLLRKRNQPAAEIFHTYYRLEAAPGVRRPVTFVFNGGPGASSAYLHLGGLAPKRVVFDGRGGIPAPPAALADNTESWLQFTDLVFIDPVGTGLSRVVESAEKPADGKAADPTKAVDEKEFYNLNRDLDALGEAIQRFLSRHKLWDVPVLLAGESYGGFRTAKLARRLQETFGIGLTAVIAISPALEWNLLVQTDYDVLHYVDVFCSMALAAAFHGKSRVFTASEPLEGMRAQIEAFAALQLAPALTLHNSAKNLEVFARAADLLGLPRELLVRARGRIAFPRFCRELLRDERRVLGFYDATITGIDPFPDRDAHEAPDPTLTGIARLFASGINHLLRSDFGLESDRLYELLSLEVNNAWKRDEQKHVFDIAVGATDDLRFAMAMNPFMKVLVTHGYYDLVTPYFASERLAAQMQLTPEQERNLIVRHFGGGHMFYAWDSSRRELRDWVRDSAL